MEIIKNGFNSEELIEVTCPHCGSILRCTEEEKRTLPCPICGHNLNTGIESPKLTFAHCDKCDYDFNTDENPKIGTYGEYYITCPLCRDRVYLGDGIDITVDNLKLEYFYSYEDAIPIKFPEIKTWIDKGIKHLKENSDENCYYTATGDSFVLVMRDGEEFYVMYTNKYKDVYIKNI